MYPIHRGYTTEQLVQQVYPPPSPQTNEVEMETASESNPQSISTSESLILTYTNQPDPSRHSSSPQLESLFSGPFYQHQIPCPLDNLDWSSAPKLLLHHPLTYGKAQKILKAYPGVKNLLLVLNIHNTVSEEPPDEPWSSDPTRSTALQLFKGSFSRELYHLLRSWRLLRLQLHFTALIDTGDPSLGWSLRFLIALFRFLSGLKHLHIEHNLQCYQLASPEQLRYLGRLETFWFAGPKSGDSLLKLVQSYGKNWKSIGVDCSDYRGMARPLARFPGKADVVGGLGPWRETNVPERRLKIRRRLSADVESDSQKLLLDFLSLTPEITTKFHHFSGNITEISTAQRIIEALPNLVSLDLSDLRNDSSVETFIQLIQTISGHTSLVHLRLNCPQMTEANAVPELATLPNIIALDLLLTTEDHSSLYNALPLVVAAFPRLASLQIEDRRYGCHFEGSWIDCPFRGNSNQEIQEVMDQVNHEYAQIVTQCRATVLKELHEQFIKREDYAVPRLVAFSAIYKRKPK